jgi:hypothetical protein
MDNMTARTEPKSMRDYERAEEAAEELKISAECPECGNTDADRMSVEESCESFVIVCQYAAEEGGDICGAVIDGTPCCCPDCRE